MPAAWNSRICELYFPILPFVENILPILIPDFQFEVVPVTEMENKYSETYPSKNLIRIREDVYLRATASEGRDRLTVISADESTREMTSTSIMWIKIPDKQICNVCLKEMHHMVVMGNH